MASTKFLTSHASEVIISLSLSLSLFFLFVPSSEIPYSVYSLRVGVNFIVNRLTVKYAAARRCQINGARTNRFGNRSDESGKNMYVATGPATTEV